jgi:hypothetical protein
MKKVTQVLLLTMMGTKVLVLHSCPAVCCNPILYYLRLELVNGLEMNTKYSAATALHTSCEVLSFPYTVAAYYCANVVCHIPS